MQTKVLEKLQKVMPEANSKGSVTVTLTATELEDLMLQLKHSSYSVLHARRVVLSSKLRKPMPTDDCYSVAEVAKRFNVTPQAVYKWIQERKIDFFEPSPGGRGYRIPKEQFKEKNSRREEFIQRRKQLFGEDAEITLKNPSDVFRNNEDPQ